MSLGGHTVGFTGRASTIIVARDECKAAPVAPCRFCKRSVGMDALERARHLAFTCPKCPNELRDKMRALPGVVVEPEAQEGTSRPADRAHDTAILEVLTDSPQRLTSEVARAIGIPRKKCSDVLLRLRREGKVEARQTSSKSKQVLYSLATEPTKKRRSS